MAFRYLIYRTDYGNTIVRESPTNTSTGGTEQALFSNFTIAKNQPLYLWRVIVIGSLVVPNTSTNINAWQTVSAPPLASGSVATIGDVTGITSVLGSEITYISGVTDTKLPIAIFNGFTGTTLPANYYNKSQINSYSAGTLTNINSRLLSSTFNTYTGTTVPNNYYNKSQINSYSAGTLTNINSRVLTSLFNSFTGTTLPANYYNKSQINSYTGTTTLQKVTSLGATTSIESTFNGGIKTHRIRPTGDTTTAIQICRAIGATPVINVDTVSGFTGFGTTVPLGLVHAFGVETITNLLGTETNAFIIDGPANVDKDIQWAENGVPKWLAETYRDENARFWYLYNIEDEAAPIVVSETGRIGLNSPSNIMNYHAALTSGNGLDDIRVGGIYTQNVPVVFQVQINGSNPDTFKWRLSFDGGINYGAYSSTSGVTTTPTFLQYGVDVSWENLTGHTSGETWTFGAFSQLPQGTFVVNTNPITEVQQTSDWSAGVVTYTDITAKANSSTLGSDTTPFATGTTLNALYFGTEVKIDGIFVNLETGGSGILLIAEYWNGSAWVNITNMANSFFDGTTNLQFSGNISWEQNSMVDWTKTYIPDLVENNYDLYWIRLRTSTVPTVSAVVNSFARGGNLRLAVFTSPYDFAPSFYIDSRGRANIGGGNMTGSNKLQINTGKNVTVTASGTDSLVEFDSECSSVVDTKIKLASNDACGPGLTFVKTRGTLDASSCTQPGDTLGRISFRGRAGTQGRLVAEMGATFVGTATSCCGSLYFSTANQGNIQERMRIRYNGNVGFGLTGATALVHLCAGTTSNAPLKFTSGSLLSSPQAGAVEFDGNSWHGTITGNSRCTFAFLESPIFTGNVLLPTTTCLGSGNNLCSYILNSGGTNNTTLTKASQFNAYTASTISHLQSSVSGATNGLSKSDCRTVVLGGPLTQNTLLSGATSCFTLCADIITLMGTNGLCMTDIGGTGVDIHTKGSHVDIRGNDISNVEKTKFLISDTQSTFTDSRAIPVGIQYNANYSTTFTNRSLVDKEYVDTTAGGLHPKTAVNIATVGPIVLSGLTVVDGIQTADGMRILVKNQTSGQTNGVYNAHAGIWTRTSDFSGNTDVINNSYFFVLSGDTNENSSWILSTANPITVGVTVLTFNIFSASSGVVAGNGICVTQGGGNFNVSVKLPANCGLCSDASGLYINPNIAGVGLCYNTGVLCLNGSGIAGNSLSWTGTQLAVNPTGGTLATALNSKLNVSAFNSYSASTLTNINSRLLTTIYSNYTGTTVPGTYETIANVSYYTGTTAPNTYYNKTQINSYTGKTQTTLGQKAFLSGATFTGVVNVCKPVQNDNSNCVASTSWYISQGSVANPLMDDTVCVGTSNLFARQDHIHPSDTSRVAVTLFNTYTGTTAPATYYNKTQINSYSASTLTNINSRVLTTLFNTYTGTTAPATYYNKTQINSYSASTLTNINSRLLTTIYSNYTGTTVPNTYYNKTQINGYTGTTVPNTYYNKTQINSYTGATRTELNLTITGATNLGAGSTIATKSGRNIAHKSLSGSCGISLSSTANAITICTIIPGADKQVIYNHGGTLSGSTGLIFCYACNALQAGVGSSATGSLSVALSCGQAPGLSGFAQGKSNFACGPYSAVIGGSGNTACIGALRSAVIGGSAIVLTGATYNDTLAASCLAIWTAPAKGDITTDRTLFWNPTVKKIEAIQLTGGSDQYFYGECATNRTTTSTRCQNAQTLCFTPLAGRYQVDFSAEFGNATANACTFGAFKIDNVIQGSNLLARDNVAAYNKSMSFSRDVTFTAALHCFDIWYWNTGGTACVPISTIRVKRIC